MERYVNGLAKEFHLLSQAEQPPLQTVFFGGGTPTLPSAALLERMLQSLHAHFSLAQGAEVTFESNPDSVDAEKLEVLRGHGVNRISFGAQTFRDHLLLAIGRAHDTEAISEAVWQAADAGFEHINIDLMFGLPDQTLDDVGHALDEVAKLPVDHVSAYWLKVEEGTPFGKWRDSGQLSLPGEDAEADMYELVRTFLRSQGFHHYEISNFAKPGGEARHNLVYWRNQGYLAAGAGAHGYVQGMRYENERKIPDYLGRVEAGLRPIVERGTIGCEERMEDQMMLGLRLAEGVSEDIFTRRFGRSIPSVFGSVVDSLLSQGHLARENGVYRIPESYWPVANAIFEKFVAVVSLN